MARSKKKDKDDHFVYCGNMKCPHTQCLRHHIYEPWNELIYERKFSDDKDWNCKNILEE